jgi:hypothetical protein
MQENIIEFIRRNSTRETSAYDFVSFKIEGDFLICYSIVDGQYWDDLDKIKIN